MPDVFDPSTMGGWIGIDEIQKGMAAEFPLFSAQAPILLEEPTQPILLYRAWHDVLGHYPDYVAQQIGSCVGHGHAHAHDLLQAIEISFGEPTIYQETDAEFIYAMSREVAGILGPIDGSYGSAAVKAMCQAGVVSREMLGAQGTDSGRRAKAWGMTGPPEAVKQQAAEFKMGWVSLIKSWPELISALWNAFPVTICSNQGFTMTRDSQGFCEPQGVWNHCMNIIGARFDRKGACIGQSWGSKTPGGPLDLEQPPFSFWADKHVIEKILSQGDSWCLAVAPDFQRQPPGSWSGIP